MPEVNFSGPSGRIEGRFHQQLDNEAPIAIILHPHPKYGGTMNNRVVYNLHYCFYNLGFSCLRFNFRGVGKSEGEFDEGMGELSDAASALDLLQLQGGRTDTESGAFAGAPGVLGFCEPVALFCPPFGPFPEPEPGVVGMRPAMEGRFGVEGF